MKKILYLLLILCFVAINNVYAEDIPKEGQIYTLTYADGSVVEVDSYEEAMNLLKQENWKKINKKSLVTDTNGEIVLPPEWKSGTVNVYESSVPKGYSAETLSNIVNLEDGNAKIVNKKTLVLGDIINPKTGVFNLLVYIIPLIVLIISGLYIRNKNKLFKKI